MWLKDDLEQVKQSWKRSPWWIRLWMLMSLFFAISSLASMSEAVADWKGFILDGVKFYQGFVSSPLQEFAAKRGMDFDRAFWDFLILLNTFAWILCRAEIISNKDENKRQGTLLLLSYLCGVLILNASLIYQKFGIEYIRATRHRSTASPELLSVIETGYSVLFHPKNLVLFVLIVIAVAMLMPRIDENFVLKSTFKIFLIQSIFVALCVGVLGAVSSGLSA